MIKNINGSKYIQVSGSSYVDPYVNPSAVGAGMIRWNASMSCLEVNDGSMWKQFTQGYPTVDLSPEAQELLEWVKNERSRQRNRMARIASNPALQKAYDAVLRAEANFDILDKIVGEEESRNSVPNS